MNELFFNSLKNKLKKSLPGIDAHKTMIPKGRTYEMAKSNYIKSAVNIVLFPIDDEIWFLLTKRSSQMSHHSGQISLPGGKIEKNDLNLWETAKRETFEETGIEINDENYIGELTNLCIPVSKFDVQPYVCCIENKPVLPPKTNEVEKFYFVKVKDFFSDSNKFIKTFKHNNQSVTTPFYKLDNEIDIVWGATAMILAEFHQKIK
jgi:8-oxo-dGTP pyrophosphatase MutT (NUDIX family)